MLLTATGNGKMVNVLALTNTDAYQKDITDFLESIILPKITPATKTTTTPLTNKNSDNTEIVGTCGITLSDQSSVRVNNGVMNYINRQYTFKADGTYLYYSITERYRNCFLKIELA